METKEKVTKKMKKDLYKYHKELLSLMATGHIIHYLNGFIAAGYFFVPQDHVLKGINPIIVYHAGMNKDGTKIVRHIEAMTLKEAEDIIKCLKIAVKRYKRDIL